jgi:phosphopantothenoylcysteine decarboxylase/phosphopantothenate--cysteine ligase
VTVVPVHTAKQMQQACEELFDQTDILLMSAAVADFRPANPADVKLKKTAADAPTQIELEQTDDILSGLADRRRPGQILVGFAAEHGAGAVAYGRGKLTRKGLDAVVVNDVSQPGIGFDADENAVTILTADGGERTVARTSKRRVAEAVLDVVAALLADQGPRERHGTAGPTHHRPAGV